MSSSESLAAMILKNMASIGSIATTNHVAALPGSTAALASNAEASCAPLMRTPTATADDHVDAATSPSTEDEYYDRWCCEHDRVASEAAHEDAHEAADEAAHEAADDYFGDYNDSYDEPFSCSGTVSHLERLRVNFSLFGLDMKQVITMMGDTSMVIGGGFMVNHIMAMTGIDKPLCPSSDIDFYVYGGITPLFNGEASDQKVWGEYNSKRVQAAAFRNLVTRRFYELVHPLGYNYTYGDGDYNCEHTESGDRIFTTGSKIRMQVLNYQATINGHIKKLNLVFSDTNMYDLITKVDIGLTAGFFCANSNYATFDYHHAAPLNVLEHRLEWMEPGSTHTPRQKERMAKYRTRYNLLETMKMTTTEFIRDFDTLPDDNIHIELKGTEDEIHSKPVVRRVLGLPSVRFSIAVTSTSLLGTVTIYSNFPSASQRADYALQKARHAEHASVLISLPSRNPSLVVHDDDAE